MILTKLMLGNMGSKHNTLCVDCPLLGLTSSLLWQLIQPLHSTSTLGEIEEFTTTTDMDLSEIDVHLWLQSNFEAKHQPDEAL